VKRGRRYLLGALAATLMGALGFLAIQPAAHAEIEYCPDGAFCVWEHVDYKGEINAFNGDMATVSPYLNDTFSSALNRTPCTVVVHWDSKFGGNSIGFAPGHTIHNLVDYGFNDQVSSVKFYC
jgi:hypothetical protein